MDDTVSAQIEKYRVLLPRIPLSHPFRSWILGSLAQALYHRFSLSHQEHDVLVTIPLLAEALLLPLGPAATRFFNILHSFYALACSLDLRFRLHHNPEDLERAVMYYRYILTLPHRALWEIDTLEVASELTKLLYHAEQTETVTEVQLDMVGEIVPILQMAPATDPSSEHIGPIAKNIGGVLVAKLGQCKQRLESEHILKLFEEIEKMCPAERSPEFYIFYGIAGSIFFIETRQYDHGKQAVVKFNTALAHLPPEHTSRPVAQLGIAMVLYIRFTQDEDPTSLEDAIYHTRVALDACPPGSLMRLQCLLQLSRSLNRRYIFSGNSEFQREADSCFQEAHSQEFPEGLRVERERIIEGSTVFTIGCGDNFLGAMAEEIQRQQGNLARVPTGHSGRPRALNDLARAYEAKFTHTQATADFEEEINYHSLALAASPPNHPVRRMSLIGLGNAFRNRFFLNKDHESGLRDIEQSIKYSRDALEMCPRGQMSRFEPLQTLALSLSARSSVLFREADLEESMALFQSALDEEYTHPRARFEIACQWASCAHIHQHPLTGLAYEKAISLMQGSLTVGPTLEVRHWLLRANWSGIHSAIPLDYASYHIEMGSLEQAVEILEQGRALLWSGMRGLRTPVDQLQASGHVMLAERFVKISNELERIATSAQHSPEANSIDAHGNGELDAFGQMMKNVRGLKREREDIIDQIRHLPGFQDFLKAVPFQTLQVAAAYGPVIMINHSDFRSDILIVLNDYAPVLIPTAKDFYTRTIALKQSLLETRSKYSLDSVRYQDALRDVLKELYELVGRPVIQELHKLGIPEQSRVWWCPTSVFCSLPLHAAGPVETEDGAKLYFQDIYISSYTPTLSALIEARNGIVDTLDRPSLLIIGQPDETLPGVRGEIKVIQSLAPSASSLIGAKATRASVLKHLSKHCMAHFACHGTLNPKRPFDAAFLFRGEERLTLLDLIRSRLVTAEFAFLSVCHAAE